MSIVRQILELFGEVNKLSVVENFCLYEAKGTFNLSSLDRLNGNLEVPLKKLNLLGVDLTITINTPEPVRILSTKLDLLNDKIDSITEYISDEGEDIDIELRIDKDLSKNFDIFNFEEFVRYLNSLTLHESLEAWGKFDLSTLLTINVWDDIDCVSTESIKFISVYPSSLESPDLPSSALCKQDRANRVEKRDKCGHFANAAQFSFVPNDFKVCINGNAELERYFNGLFNAFLIIYLSDFSSICNNILKYRLKGYKLLSESISLDKLSNHNSKELSSIYEWTFLEGNYTDKIGLARNIISIHLENETLLSIESGTTDSIQSGYDLYLKDNVKQYIEIKNKISEFIQSQSDKALEMTKNMFSMFKTGLWTFTTFFITVFLLRVVNKGTVVGAFSFEVFIVSMLLIVISSIYLLISVLEINSDRDRLLEKYTDIRHRYKDLLNKSDLDKILDVNQVSNKEKDYINEKRNRYIWVWILTNFIIAVAVCVLYFSSNKIHFSVEPENNQEVVVSESVVPTKSKMNNNNDLTMEKEPIKNEKLEDSK